ncbi:MAG: hypothetical protein KAG97_13445, partial [Victivallales bacterium]|nr:hypothetical protein [Victivallales bacterium]
TMRAKLTISVDRSQDVGKIRRINGLNNGPLMTVARQQDRITEELKALKLPRMRFHDAALQNRGYDLLDISRIFPLFHADASNPANYCFAESDDYLLAALETCPDLEYLLGESSEHSKNKYRINVPEDMDKWAEICVNIIRHYNEGWAGGLKHNIKYWSVWEEPTNPLLLGGVDLIENYMKLYDVTAKKIKSRFPHLKVGGPNTGWKEGYYSGEENFFWQFAANCRMHNTPLDFISMTHYVSEPESLAKSCFRAREVLDLNGFKDSEVFLVEWHMPPATMPPTTKEDYDELFSIDSGAFTFATLILLQDAPVDMANFYESVGSFGIFTPAPVSAKSVNYYAHLAFAEMA